MAKQTYPLTKGDNGPDDKGKGTTHKPAPGCKPGQKGY